MTGGGQGTGKGIGKGMAKRLLEEGMSVVIAEIDEEAGRETESQFQSLETIRFFQTDVTDEATVEASVRRTKREFGRRRRDARLHPFR